MIYAVLIPLRREVATHELVFSELLYLGEFYWRYVIVMSLSRGGVCVGCVGAVLGRVTGVTHGDEDVV
jgi:hypothetical protein